jgi:hypothetical protein
MEDQQFRKSPRLLNEFEQIVASVDKHQGISGLFFKEVWPALRDIGKFLDISAQESALFARVLAASGEEPVSAAAIAKRINCNYIQFLKYLDSFENLERKRLIRPYSGIGGLSRSDPFENRTRTLNPTYVIPLEVIKAVREGRKYKFEAYDKLSPQEFFITANRLMLGLRDEDTGYDTFVREVHDLFEANRGIAFVKNLPTNLESEDIFLLLLVSCKTVLEGEGVFRAAAIEPKELFYTEKVSSQVEELKSLLRRENLRTVQRRLRDSHMRTGFNCLFSGPPGTGKTETAYQLARDTGRDIFLVDASETKSMWFGQSEKKIKELFDRYRSLVKAGSITPILLFNEADAVIWKTLMPGIPKSAAQMLSARYDFSGGQIENVARKQMVSSVLHGGRIKLETLAAFCDQESQEKARRPIGFTA